MAQCHAITKFYGLSLAEKPGGTILSSSNVYADGADQMADWVRSARRPHRHETLIETASARDDRRYRTAHRHSAFVRALRVLLPVVIIAATGGFIGAAYLGNTSLPGVSFTGIDVKSNSLVMENPQVSGFNGSKHSYELSASKAVQNLQSPEVVTLEGIDARLGIDTGDSATLGAGRGIYDSKAETLQLRDGITVKTSTGYHANLKRADVDLKSGVMRASEPVELRSADGTIRGNEVEIVEGGKRIIFSKGVSMTLGSPSAGEPGSTPVSKP
jgi:lipopolysaccharide export system protein LptC